MYDLFLKTIEKYHFRDEQGNPIENCEEVKHMLQEMQHVLDYYKYGSSDVVLNEKGCPCGGDCCNNPQTGFFHECDSKCDEIFCDDRCCFSCKTCLSECYCEL